MSHSGSCGGAGCSGLGAPFIGHCSETVKCLALVPVSYKEECS